MLYAAECQVDMDCVNSGGVCNQGICSRLNAFAYACNVSSDCDSGFCDRYLPDDTETSCFISGGDFCDSDFHCGAGLYCTPYSNARYCDSQWHGDAVPQFEDGKPCRADINCGGLNLNCVAGLCSRGKSYYDECTRLSVGTECAGGAVCFQAPTDNVTRCTQPAGNACASDDSCPGYCVGGFCTAIIN